MENLDEAIEKANRLVELLKEASLREVKKINEFSKEIENFLKFLRDCNELNTSAAVTVIDMDNKTQDTLHNIELNENSQYAYICQGFTLHNIREKRREAKDAKAVTTPIVEWVYQNKKTINDLEKLLGEVRKAEKRTENRTYRNRTKIMDGLLD